MTDRGFERPLYPPVLPTDASVPKACTFSGAREVLTSKALSSATHVTDWDLLGGTIMTVDGEEHSARRRLEGALFKIGTLKRYEKESLQPAIDSNLQRAAETMRGRDGVVHADLVRLTRMMMLSISASIIGLDDVERLDRRERLGNCLDHLIEGALVEWSMRDHTEIMAAARTWKQIYSEEFVAPSLERRKTQHRANPAVLLERPDLLSILVADDTDPWEYERILRECTLYLVASSLTSSTAATHTVGHLDSWLREHPEYEPKTGDSQFLRIVAMEALRLHPGPHILLRRAGEDVDVATECIHVAKGQVVGADVRQANRDPQRYGSSPESFDPLRELEKEVPREGFTFGGGKHLCIGRPFALGINGGRDEDSVDGILVRMLRSLYRAGVRPDPENPAKKAESVHDRYERYPVIFRNL